MASRDQQEIEQYEREFQARLRQFSGRYQVLREEQRLEDDRRLQDELAASKLAEQRAAQQREEQEAERQRQQAARLAEAEELLKEDGSTPCPEGLPEQTVIFQEYDPGLKGPIIWPDLKGVYFALTEPTIVKIGFATNIYQRMVQHQGSVIRTLIPLLLYMPGDKALEDAIKDEFHALRAPSDRQHRELFYYRDALHEFINDQRKKVLGLGPFDPSSPAVMTSFRGLPSWFRKHHTKAQNHTCLSLLSTSKFRSPDRRALRARLEAWLEAGPKNGSPFTDREWRYLNPWISGR